MAAPQVISKYVRRRNSPYSDGNVFGIRSKQAKLDWHVQELRALHRILVESLEAGHRSDRVKALYNICEHARRAKKLIEEIEHHYGSPTEQTGFARIVLEAATNAANDTLKGDREEEGALWQSISGIRVQDRPPPDVPQREDIIQDDFEAPSTPPTDVRAPNRPGICPSCASAVDHAIVNGNWDGLTPEGIPTGGALYVARCSGCSSALAAAGPYSAEPSDLLWRLSAAGS